MHHLTFIRSSLIIILLSVNLAPAQEKESFYGDHLFTYLWSGAHHTLKDPFNQWVIGGAFLGALAANSVDNKFQEYVQEKGLLPKELSRFGDLYGGTWAHWILFSAIAGKGVLKGESKTELLRKLEYAVMAIGVNGVLTVGLKKAVGRERPNKGDNSSFPSGHTSHSFTIAAVSNELFGSKVGVPAYAIAGIVATSRIHDNKHYLSDVIFGAGLGTIIGRGFAYPYQRGMKSFSIYPNSQGELTVAYFF